MWVQLLGYIIYKKMVIGCGDIGSVLTHREHLTFFACGVSNSKELDPFEYEREARRLMNQDKSKRLVYFSSLSIYYSDTRYTRHKMFMEELVKQHFTKYCIIRLGNITWGKNPHTLLNFLKANPNAERRNETRYLINKDEFLHWINLIPNFNTEMNLTGKLINVKEL